MLALAFVLGLSILVVFFREGWSDTYRCPYCTQLEMGTYHRLKCFVVHGEKGAVPVAAAEHSHEHRNLLNLEGFGLPAWAGVQAAYKQRIVARWPAILGRR